MVVRVFTGGAPVDGKVEVRLVAQGETAPNLLEVKDDGATPDVAAGDGVYSASAALIGDVFEVGLTVGDHDYPGGTVSWSEADAARDLTLTLSDGNLTAVAETSAGAQAGAAAPGEPSADGATPVDPGTLPAVAPSPEAALSGGPVASAPTGGPSAAPSGTPGAPISPTANMTVPRSDRKDKATLFIAFGGGLILLVGIAWVWTLTRRGSAVTLPPQLAEPGLLGPQTPSLSDGASTWRASADAVPELAWGLAARIARTRRVLVVAPESLSLPPIHGGPCYRLAELDADQIADVVDALNAEGGSPVAVLLVGEGAEDALDRVGSELPAGAALVLVATAGAQADPRAVSCEKVAGDWHLSGPDGVSAVQVGPYGFEPIGPGAA